MIAGGCLHQISHQYSAAPTKHKREKKTQIYKNGGKIREQKVNTTNVSRTLAAKLVCFDWNSPFSNHPESSKLYACYLLCIISFSAHTCIHIVYWWNLVCCLVYFITCFLKYELGQGLHFLVIHLQHQ